LVNVRIVEGVFTKAQKREMINKLTETMVSIDDAATREGTG